MSFSKDNIKKIKKTPKIKELPESERPREKIISKGVFSLSDSELFAVLLGSGNNDMSSLDIANTLLAHEESITEFSTYIPEEFMRIKGIGCAKACILSAAIEIGRRIATSPPPRTVQIDNPGKAAAIFMGDMRFLKHETFCIAMLNIKNELIGKKTISIGSLNSSSAHPREVFSESIRKGACGIILCHNHPSGDPTPSQADIDATRKLIDAGKLLGVAVQDHIIIGNGIYKSFREEGIF